MAATRASLVLVAFLATLGGAGAARQLNKVTPVEKVTELLEGLQKKVEEEGKTEAAQYDKYACFCKEEADTKLYNIETSEKKEAALNAKIGALDGEITTLGGEIGQLSQDISGLKQSIKAAEGTMARITKTYNVEVQDVKDAISAAEGAIEALKSAKSKQGGKTNLEALVQVRSAAALVLAQAGSSRVELSDKQLETLAALAKQPGQAYEYEFHSNDIISVIEDLRSKFIEERDRLDQEQFETNSAFEKKRLGLQNEQKFAEKEKAEKEAEMEAKTEEKEKASEDLSQEVADHTADQNFLNVLTSDCQTKAQLFDQRSKVRSAEITAMSEAIKALKEGVQPNYSANKKLVGLQIGSHPPAAVGAPSFLQVRRSGRRAIATVSKEKAKVERAAELLLQRAERLHSSALSAAALKVRAAEDHFVKVRGLIKDLLARLKDEASQEQTQKSFCDNAMSNAISDRDTEQSILEDLEAQITGKTAEKETLLKEIAELSEAIAQNKKELNEATLLREEDHAENEKTLADADSGRTAVEFAITTLKEGTTWYDASLMQTQKYVPTNSDREGNTLADKAPEVFDSQYGGAVESGKGIVGMLDVILSDFDRTQEAVADEEEEQLNAYNTLKGNLESDTETKEGSVKLKKGQVSDLEDDLLDLEDKKTAAAQALKTALGELQTLHAQCVAGEETYEERVAKRNKEIEALKEAHGILEDWQS